MKYDPPNTPSAKQYAIHCQFEEEDGEEISQAKKKDILKPKKDILKQFIANFEREVAKRYRKPRKDILKQFIDNFRTKILGEISQAEKRHFTISNCQFYDEDIKIVITSQR